MLNHEIGDDDVANRQSRIQPAGDTGKNDCAAAESVGQQRGDDRGVDLAHPGAGQHHVMSVDGARVEDGVRSILAVGAREGIAQVCEFLRMAQISPMGTLSI